MRIFTLSMLISMIIFLVTCQENRDDHAITRTELKFETFSQTWLAPNCELDTTLCARVEVDYPMIADDPTGMGKVINDSILYFVKSSINSFQIEASATDVPISNLVNDFFTEYEVFLQDFPDFEMPWSVEIKGNVLYNSPKIISIELEQFSFTGGAHPNYGITLLTFDLERGKPLYLEDVINDKEQLKGIAKEKFRVARELEQGESLENAGFYFGDSFTLPSNFALTKDGLYLFYNPYEVGAYVLGSTSFTIPYKEIEDILTIN